MSYEGWLGLIGSEGFWGGVLASILAAIVIGIAGYIFRKSIRAFSERQEQSRKENEIFESALSLSSPFAPFAFGVVQGRALRYFVVAVFIAYVGDILGVFWPLNIGIYCISLIFIFQSLRWFFKIETRAMEILRGELDD